MDKNHEMWILKGSVEQALKHEKLLFINGVYPYDNPDTNKSELIKKMNKIISSHLESYFTVVGEYRQNLEDNPLPKKNGNGNGTTT